MTPEQKEAERLIELFAKGPLRDPMDILKIRTTQTAKAFVAIHCRGVIDVLKKLNPEYEENTYWHPIDHWTKILELLTNK